ncbi:MAG: 4-(cytidine 5'-diphospho)-2-C-methyl-D-erythritol kinase [Proteobacteria bacterium]|nr:4-(cytidine 5'-diphospho)-2-C-methyl-D-erythritol kinase [Pseudomonadota bacterium]MBU1714546.1 4-(cytidine 5'-diphospho)-2-C-methyl-D-erythritol kinase [Pseudomonadota bacterium]
MTVSAPAKINLGLKIKGKREDGYHDLFTVLQKLQLADILHLSIRQSAEIVLKCPDSNLPVNDDNLVVQAARAFFQYFDSSCGVEIVLEKRVPIAAGLGGGSSDAAAVLRGLNRLFGKGLSREQLIALARPLGVDVPFFVTDYNAAEGQGVGDILKPVAGLGDCWVVLVNPDFEVSTKWVYENFALTTDGNPYILAPGLNRIFKDKSGEDTAFFNQDSGFHLFNDLESVTIGRFPVLAEIKNQLLRAGAVGALMSGSGPTVFGIFLDYDRAVSSCKRFSGRFRSVFLTKPL